MTVRHWSGKSDRVLKHCIQFMNEPFCHCHVTVQVIDTLFLEDCSGSQ